jgi:transcription elongation factor Elf1
MNRIRLFLKPRNLAFFTLVSLLLVTAIIKVPCPVCGGSGSVNGTPGMENVTIVEIESQKIKAQRDVCGIYIVIRCNVSVRLLNDGKDKASGWLKMMLIDTSQEAAQELLDTQYVKVEVPPGSITDNTYTIFFGTGLDRVGTTTVNAEVVLGKVACKACNGSGKVALNAFPFISSLKPYLDEQIRETSPYNPPVYIDWANYVFFNQ